MHTPLAALTSDDITILGIETSCDETGAAVYNTQSGLVSHALYSQIALHVAAGGVIPEIGSRSQLEKIKPIITKALTDAGITLQDLDVIAVTHKPGLPGSLLVGVSYAKALAFALNKKLIGVNHLEGHVFSSFLQHSVPFPHLCITASGGHTSLYLVKDFGDYQELGSTRDDAAGEAFDKIAKLIGLPYPGGPIIEKRAQQAGFQDYFHYPRTKIAGYDFSFSGLKTAVLYDLIKRGWYDLPTKTLVTLSDEIINQICSSLLVCIADIFVNAVERGIHEFRDIKAVSFVGGVACNKYIAGGIRELCHKHSLELYVPSPAFCTDNGAMISFVGTYKAIQGKFSDLYLDILK